SLLVDAMLTQVRPVELRYYLGQVHYRSQMEYSPEALAEAVAAYRGIEGFVMRAAELVGAQGAGGQGPAAAPDPGTGAPPASAGLPPAVTAAPNGDLPLPPALPAAHEN